MLCFLPIMSHKLMLLFQGASHVTGRGKRIRNIMLGAADNWDILVPWTYLSRNKLLIDLNLSNNIVWSQTLLVQWVLGICEYSSGIPFHKKKT